MLVCPFLLLKNLPEAWPALLDIPCAIALLPAPLGTAWRACIPLGRRSRAGSEGSSTSAPRMRRAVPLPVLGAQARVVLGLPVQLHRASPWTWGCLAPASRATRVHYFRGYKGNLFQTGSWQSNILRLCCGATRPTLKHHVVACSEAWLSLAQRVSGLDHGCSQPSWVAGHVPLRREPPVSGHCSAESARPVQITGLRPRQQKSQRVEAAASQGVSAPTHPTASTSSGKSSQLTLSHWDGQRSPSMGAHQLWAAPFPKCACVCAGTRGHPAPLPSARWPPARFLWCRMFNMMTFSIEAMCCHNVTSLNKVFRAVFTEPEHEQQNPPITVSFCVVVKVSNVSNFLW